MADQVFHIIEIPSQNIYWCTADEDVTINGQVYQGFSDAVSVSAISRSMLHPQGTLRMAFGVNGNDPQEIDTFVNQIGHVPVRVSLMRFKR